MSYDPMLDAMLAISIGMITGSGSEGLEAVQNAEQNRARNDCRLPKKMNPSKEAFEAIGFVFEDIDDDVLCKANLPDGWKLKHEEGDGYWTTLIDEKCRKRGNSFYKGAFYDREGLMNLHRRFHVSEDVADLENWNGPYTISVKDADGTVLYTAGKCDKIYSKEYYELMTLAKEYLDTNYPEWKEPTKYWD